MDNEYFASINEVSKKLDVPAHTLRYWEKQFPVAIRPTTGAGGRRYYRTETVNRLMVIKELLYNRGMTIAGVKKLMRDGNLPTSADDLTFAAPRPSAHPTQSNDATSRNTVEIDAVISMLQSAHEILEQ